MDNDNHLIVAKKIAKIRYGGGMLNAFKIQRVLMSLEVYNIKYTFNRNKLFIPLISKKYNGSFGIHASYFSDDNVYNSLDYFAEMCIVNNDFENGIFNKLKPRWRNIRIGLEYTEKYVRYIDSIKPIKEVLDKQKEECLPIELF